MFQALTLLFVLHQVFAQVLVQSEDTSDQDYQNMLMSNRKYKSYSENWLQAQQTNEVHDLLIRGQFHFLQGSLQDAKKIFSEIVSVRLNSPWDKATRKKIAYAFMRLAQLEEAGKEQDDKIIELLNYDFDMEPDPELFPPPLIERWKNLKTNYSQVKVLLPEGYEKYQQILVNGKDIGASGRVIDVPASEIRLDFVSNKLQPLTLKLRAEDLETYKLKFHPFARGSCRSPELAVNEPGLNVVFGDSCIISADKVMFALTPERNLVQSSDIPAEPVNATSFWSRNRTAIWIGAAALAAITGWQVIEAGKNHGVNPRTEYIPTHKTISSP